MTPNEEIAFHLIKNRQANSITGIIKHLKLPYMSNFGAVLRSLEQQGLIHAKDCPTCQKKGYYE